tara:strand:- start:48818 stop:49432 length:615 start_codon:yes stop_codon:yes gene_type:complete
MVIGITLNEVLRDFLGQLTYTYEKYFNEIDLEEEDVKSMDLINYYKFDSIDDMNKFLYTEAALEIFGHAGQKTDNLMTRFNEFITEVSDDEEHTIKIISREADKSIPATMFFLSKLGCRATDIDFVIKYEDKWNDIDVLVTANPKAIELKPKGKVSVKIDSSYNEDVKSDFKFGSLSEFMDDEYALDNIEDKLNKGKTKKRLSK